jgi:hypothetical protein
MVNIRLQIYAALWNKFGERQFSTKEVRFLELFMSKGMKKKVLFELSEKNWVKREGRGNYRCVNPKVVFEEFFKPRVMNLLKDAKMEWCFYGLNALEVYTNFSVEHRSWLSSPFYIKVLKKDLKKWLRLFKKHDINAHINESKAEFGEYVILIPSEEFRSKTVNNYPVEPLENVIKFAEQRKFEFAYELKYLSENYGIRAS